MNNFSDFLKAAMAYKPYIFVDPYKAFLFFQKDHNAGKLLIEDERFKHLFEINGRDINLKTRAEPKFLNLDNIPELETPEMFLDLVTSTIPPNRCFYGIICEDDRVGITISNKPFIEKIKEHLKFPFEEKPLTKDQVHVIFSI